MTMRRCWGLDLERRSAMRALTERDDNILNGTDCDPRSDPAAVPLVARVCDRSKRQLDGWNGWACHCGHLGRRPVSAGGMARVDQSCGWALPRCLSLALRLYGRNHRCRDPYGPWRAGRGLGGCRDLAVPQHPTGQTCLSHGGCSAGVALRIRTLWRTRNARSSSRRTSTGIGI